MVDRFSTFLISSAGPFISSAYNEITDLLNDEEGIPSLPMGWASGWHPLLEDDRVSLPCPFRGRQISEVKRPIERLRKIELEGSRTLSVTFHFIDLRLSYYNLDLEFKEDHISLH